MFGTYLEVLRLPGALRFTLSGLLARMQLSMAGLGAVMLLSASRGSYAVAGTVAALYAVSAALVGPQVSRLIDSFGQRRIVPLQLAVHLPAVAGLVSFAVFTDLNWPVFVLALFAGSSTPAVGALVRARWSNLLRGSPQLRTAFAWEALIDEFVFIVGPPLATILALQITPSAALIIATVALVTGTVLLITQRSTEPPAAGRSNATTGRPAILLPGVAGITAIFVLLGGIFGSYEVATVAFAKEEGAPAAAGLILALYAVGSLAAGVVYGALTLRAPLSKQFLVATGVLAVVTFPLPLLGHLWLVAAGLFVAGIACSPVLIAGTALLEHIVPSNRLTEAMTWNASGLAVGIAVASPLAGVVIDRYGAAVAYWVTAGCGVLAFAVAALVYRSLRRADLGATPTEKVLTGGQPQSVAVEKA